MTNYRALTTHWQTLLWGKFYHMLKIKHYESSSCSVPIIAVYVSAIKWTPFSRMLLETQKEHVKRRNQFLKLRGG